MVLQQSDLAFGASLSSSVKITISDLDLCDVWVLEHFFLPLDTLHLYILIIIGVKSKPPLVVHK